MNGFLSINKPTGMTSSDVVVKIRHMLPRKTAIGHGGTLDPEASGVLPLCVGKATRLFDYIVDKQKSYMAVLQLGMVSDTQDATGRIISTHEVDTGEDALRDVIAEFTGDIEQIPPMYSAIKRQGKRMYQLARKGESIELEPRNCHVERIEIIQALEGNRYVLRVDCGKGVYIRTLCHDIGAQLGCGGMMASLERVSTGIFSLDDALTMEQVKEAIERDALQEVLIPMDAPLYKMPMVRVCRSAEHAVRNGNRLKREWCEVHEGKVGETVRVYLGDTFAGIGEIAPDFSIRFRAMLMEI